MMKVVLALCVAAASAFSPVAPAYGLAAQPARSDVVVMAAKKKGVNPALFSTGIAPKAVARSTGRKAFKAGTGDLRPQDGSWKGNKPWLAGQKAENAKVSPWQRYQMRRMTILHSFNVAQRHRVHVWILGNRRR